MDGLLILKFSTRLMFTLAFFSTALFAGSSVSFRSDTDFSAIVPVYLNNSGPYSFLLDTGSGKTQVSLEVLKQLRVPIGRQQNLITASGANSVDCYHIEVLRVGDKITRGVDVLGVPIGTGKQIPLSGVLGQDFLGQFDYILDYGNRKLIFEDANEFKVLLEKGIDVYEMHLHAQLMLIMLPPQSPRKKPFLLVLDSGITDLVIFSQTLEAYGLDLDYRSLKPAFLSTVLGQEVGLGGVFRCLRLKGSKLNNKNIYISPPLQINNILIEDGLLPASFFRSLYVCNSRSLIALNPISDVFP